MQSDASVLDELLQTEESRALAREYLAMARKYTRVFPAALPAQPAAPCAFLASMKYVRARPSRHTLLP